MSELSTTDGRYSEDELKECLKNPSDQFKRGPIDLLAPFAPGTHTEHTHTFLVQDDNLVTGRFWGDAYALGFRLARMLEEADDSDTHAQQK